MHLMKQFWVPEEARKPHVRDWPTSWDRCSLNSHLGSRTVADPVLTHRGSLLCGPILRTPPVTLPLRGAADVGLERPRLSKDTVEALAGGRVGSGAASVASADERHSVLDRDVLAS